MPKERSAVPLTVEQQKLAEEQFLRVRKFASHLSKGWKEQNREMFISECLLDLVFLAKKYDPLRGIPFEHLVIQMIRWRFQETKRNYVRDLEREKELSLLFRPLSQDKTPENHSKRMDVSSALENLTWEKGKKIAHLVYVDGLTNEEVQEVQGLTRNKVEYLKLKIKRMLRNRLRGWEENYVIKRVGA